MILTIENGGENETSSYNSSWKRINILDISQTIVGGFFNMMMIVDVTAFDDNYQDMADGLEALSDDIGCTVKIQREEIFDSMNRI